MNSLIQLLRQKYNGLRRDIYGEEYSTIYTSLVDAIYARDKVVYQPIFNSNGIYTFQHEAEGGTNVIESVQIYTINCVYLSSICPQLIIG